MRIQPLTEIHAILRLSFRLMPTTSPSLHPMNEQLEVIYRAPRQHQAHLLQSLLAEYNIEARLVGGSRSGGESTDGHDGTMVLVNPQDVKIANGILDAFNRHVIAATTPPEEFEDWPPKVWSDWPTCPKCDSLKQVCCPVCNAASTSFELGFTNQFSEEQPDTDEILLICSDCDEPFAPKFYRQCVWCGHDFGDGQQLSNSIGKPSATISARPFAVLVTLTVLGGAAVFYFWRLFS